MSRNLARRDLVAACLIALSLPAAARAAGPEPARAAAEDARSARADAAPTDAAATDAAPTPAAGTRVAAVRPTAPAGGPLDGVPMEVELLDETADPASRRPWSVTAQASAFTGLGVLNANDHVRSSQAYFALGLNANGTWRLRDQLVAGLALSGALELTTPDDLSGRRFWPGDPVLSLSHTNLFDDAGRTGIKVSGGLRMSVGLSPTSLWRTQLGSLGANLNASRSFLSDRLNVSLGLSGTGFLHRYTAPVGPRESADGVDYVVARLGGSEDLGAAAVAAGGFNPLAAAGFNLSASYQVLDALSAAVSFGANRVWKYGREPDHLSAPILDADGEPVVGGTAMDVFQASLSASYQVDQRWSVSAVLSGQAQPLSADNKRIQLPFFNPNLSANQFIVSAAASF